MRTTESLVKMTAAAFAMSLLSGPLAAQTPKQTESGAQEQAKSQSAELICRTEKVIGSRAKKRRICLTERQWREVARKGGDFARVLVESGRAGIRWDDQ